MFLKRNSEFPRGKGCSGGVRGEDGDHLRDAGDGYECGNSIWNLVEHLR